MSGKPLTNKRGEVRELTTQDIRAMRPAADVLPHDLVAVLPKRRRGKRGPQKAPAKRMVTLRLDPDIVDHFKADGPGWQVRINDTLRRAMRR